MGEPKAQVGGVVAPTAGQGAAQPAGAVDAEMPPAEESQVAAKRAEAAELLREIGEEQSAADIEAKGKDK
eukprot:15431293-Alexandrium_andersonii.AAC.1